MRPSTKRLVARTVAAGSLFLMWTAAPLTAIASAGEVPAAGSDEVGLWILSALILGIGFLMIAFTQRKQGLHDILAGTLVIRGQAPSIPATSIQTPPPPPPPLPS